MMDMRGTAPFEGWDHGSQTPEATQHDGIQRDGLHNFMDRRSYVSASPEASYPSESMSGLYEECEMDE